MPTILLITDGDECWPDLAAKRAEGRTIWHLANRAPALQFALLKGGMASGHASVTIRIDLDNGDVVLAETSLGALATVVSGLLAVPGATIPP